ncbi:DUF7373 family lipoprotein [Nocardia camponoti]|uniref:Lipoprotein n=1 Tax=Nocardia camponoti TaxID=1616106 RepID=A0A917QMV2_9NOCA|nr:hypothetical protein [Nocardia camponoti]GGK57113.1 hypothetical protein GCM10011591_31570 [Nocardia camponoti]
MYMFRFAAAIIVVASVSSCAVAGSAVPGELDVRTLATGSFDVDKHRYTDTAGSAGALVEGVRMAATIAPTVRIDPSLTYGRGDAVLSTVTSALDYVANVSRPILENRKYVTGYATAGADEENAPGAKRPGPTATVVTTSVLRFPDATTATLAARELEDADLGVSPDNRKLPSTKYPAAYLHWRPGIPSIGVFHAYNEFVISGLIQRPRADATDLTQWAEKSLAATLAQLAKFTPTPASNLSTLPVDPGNLLARAVVDKRTDLRPNEDTFAVYPAEHLTNISQDQKLAEETIAATGMDFIGEAGSSTVTRVRDQQGAEKLMQSFLDRSSHYDPMSAPSEVPGAKCLVLNSNGNAEKEYRYRCYVPYKRYLATVRGDKEPEIRQKVAAQYALLANSS